jgi:hypothetical protein
VLWEKSPTTDSAQIRFKIVALRFFVSSRSIFFLYKSASLLSPSPPTCVKYNISLSLSSCFFSPSYYLSVSLLFFFYFLCSNNFVISLYIVVVNLLPLRERICSKNAPFPKAERCISELGSSERIFSLSLSLSHVLLSFRFTVVKMRSCFIILS